MAIPFSAGVWLLVALVVSNLFLIIYSTTILLSLLGFYAWARVTGARPRSAGKFFERMVRTALDAILKAFYFIVSLAFLAFLLVTIFLVRFDPTKTAFPGNVNAALNFGYGILTFIALVIAILGYFFYRKVVKVDDLDEEVGEIAATLPGIFNTALGFIPDISISVHLPKRVLANIDTILNNFSSFYESVCNKAKTRLPADRIKMFYYYVKGLRECGNRDPQSLLFFQRAIEINETLNIDEGGETNYTIKYRYLIALVKFGSYKEAMALADKCLDEYKSNSRKRVYIACAKLHAYLGELSDAHSGEIDVWGTKSHYPLKSFYKYIVQDVLYGDIPDDAYVSFYIQRLRFIESGDTDSWRISSIKKEFVKIYLRSDDYSILADYSLAIALCDYYLGNCRGAANWAQRSAECLNKEIEKFGKYTSVFSERQFKEIPAVCFQEELEQFREIVKL